MGKYLQEIEIFPSNLYGEEKSNKLSEETRGLLYALNKNFNRKLYSRFGKIVIMLWPIGTIVQKEGLIPPYEYDDISSVAVVNIEFDIDLYFDEKNISDRYLIIHNVLLKVFSDLPPKIGLEKKEIFDVLERVRNEGFIYKKFFGRKVSSPSKKITVQLFFVFDAYGKHASALVTNKADNSVSEVPIYTYSIYDFGIMESPSKLVFIDENNLELQHNDDRYSNVSFSINHK